MTLILKEYTSFFGSNRGVEDIIKAIEEMDKKPTHVDFSGVKIINNTHGNVVEFLRKTGLKPINMLENDLKNIELFLNYDNNYISYASLKDRIEDTKIKFPKGSFSVLVNCLDRKRQRTSLVFINNYNNRGVLLQIFYEHAIKNFREGDKLRTDKRFFYNEEISWQDFDKGNFFLKPLTTSEKKFVEALETLSGDKR